MTMASKIDVRMCPAGNLYLCEDGEPVRRLQPGADDEVIDSYPTGPDLDETPEDE
jgi:hypothetical protein